MTTTRPAPSLADVIRDAEYQWKDLHLAGMAGYNALPRGSRVDHIAAAVAAHLASDAVIERMARNICLDAGWDWDVLPRNQAEWTTEHLKRSAVEYVHGPFRDDYIDAARAAVAAVVGEAGNG